MITRKQVQDEIHESQALEAASAQLAAKLRSPSAGERRRRRRRHEPAPSSSGFIWPVSGPITSPFGMRWGTLHPGIDIGVADGHADPRGRLRHRRLVRLDVAATGTS